MSFGRYGAWGGLALVALVVAGLLWSGAGSSAATARHPVLFGGSLVLEDSRPLTVIDVATAKVSVRLPGIDQQVAAATYGDVQAVPVAEGTMLVNRKTGTFNLLQQDNYVLDAAGPGVGLGRLAGATAAAGYASGPDVYIVRTAPSSTVSLVGEATVAQAERLEAAVQGRARAPSQITPLGFVSLEGEVSNAAGSAAVEGGNLWVLVPSGGRCLVQELKPGRQSLSVTTRTSFPVGCGRVALEAGTGVMGAASPGRIVVFKGPVSSDVALPASTPATSFLPVGGVAGDLVYLARFPSGWSLVRLASSGAITGPVALSGLGSRARPAAPVLSGGYLYTLDRAATDQPDLWAISTDSGQMAPVAGATRYPAFSSTEKAGFGGAEVLVDGPRVVFNNPQSLDAVVVFTDGSHAPVVIDKSQAVAVSATGPADLNLTPAAKAKGPPGRGPTRPPAGRAVPVVQQVNQQITCQSTTQKPYAPQITGITASSQAAQVSWSYQLLDQTDCEPDSWSVQMVALSSSHQPAPSTQRENGQQQYLFRGLRPATTYQAVVTAYINTQFTSSPPITFTTPARGPDAPRSVSTTADGKGDWVVSWQPCTEAVDPNCVVPADIWTVTGAVCGSAEIAQPPTVQVPGTQDQVTINADALGLLGDSVSFTVQGSLSSGLSGNPTSDRQCTLAWRPPEAKDITLTASGQPVGQTVEAHLVVNTSTSTTEAFGSPQTEFVYQVGGHTVGPTASPTATVTGLAGGQSYTPTVTIYPNGHRDAAVTVTGHSFTQNLSWPANLGIAVTPSVDSSDPNQGKLAVTFPNLPAGPMDAAGNYVCGSTQGPQVAGPVTAGVLSVVMDLVQFGGTCSLTLTVDDTASPDPYGIASPALNTSFTIGTAPSYQFTDQVSPDCQQNFCLQEQIEVDFAGPGQPAAGGNWSLVAHSADQGPDLCASSQNLGDHPQFPQTITLPVTCPDPKKVDVAVDFNYLGTGHSVDAGSPNGTPATTTSTTSTTTCSTTGSNTTACTNQSTQNAAFLARPSGNRDRDGALAWAAGGLAAGWAGAGLRRLRSRAGRTKR